ncbi:MAG TPA: glycosyltransferase, partial [Gemmatales bacterium]|nr:glycosyltransferase [Gemmatales bacterium]
MGEEKNIAGASGFHLLSEEEKQGLLSVRPYLKNREFVIAPNGLGQVPEEIRQGLIQERFPEVQGMQTLLFLGRLDEIKGLELPLEAVALLEPKLRPMVLLVGPDFGVEARLRELVSKLGIAPWVLFAGPIYGDDRFSLLYEADIVGLTSHYECNSVTGTETFAVGGCMLATEGTSLRQAGQANAAWIVPRTAQAYADGLRKLLTDDLLRHQLRQSAKLYAQRHLDWDRLVKPIIECYKRILERKT